MIAKERIRKLNDKQRRTGDYVLYWMQASQRVEYNHALDYATSQANSLSVPLVVFFGLTEDFPEANLRHYRFMLEGLQETKSKLENRGIKTVIRFDHPPTGVAQLSSDAALVVVDRGYLRVERNWREEAAETVKSPLLEVETDAIVPVEEASQKEEYAAYTLRKKLEDRLDKYLSEMEPPNPKADSLGLKLPLEEADISCLKSTLDRMDLDTTVAPVSNFRGGPGPAKELLSRFIQDKLDDYGELSNDPVRDNQSGLSPYLHFGQISPLKVALEVIASESPGVDDYLEQLIVRRELSLNFIRYNDHYDQLPQILPDWAESTLAAHEDDQREYEYSRKQFESASTHDPYWNAAQKEMVLRGKMHGYMRMYWGKKILEWSESPRQAFNTALYLNNKYELDGRDPNGYAGVAWCFGKHDRAWKERAVLGKVRYMSASGLERKFDIDRYVEQVENLKDR